MAGALINGPWQVELQNVLMDGCGQTNPLIITKWLTGHGVPKLRGNDKPRPQASGDYPSPRYLPSRVFMWAVRAQGANNAAVLTALTNLGQAFAPIPDSSASFTVPLVFTLGDSTVQYLVNGIPEQADFNYDRWVRSSVYSGAGGGGTTDPALSEGVYTSEIPLTFIATDPVIYRNVLNSLSTGIGTSSGGLAFPFAFPFAFGTSSPGSVVCTNAGNTVSYPIITITAGAAGLSGITITKAATGDQWTINISLSVGDTLTIDMAAHTVLLNGSASRANLVIRPPSVWFGLDPSPTVLAGQNTIQFTGTGAGSTMQVQWRDAYLL